MLSASKTRAALQVKRHGAGDNRSLIGVIKSGRLETGRPFDLRQSQRRILRTDPSSRWMVTVRHPWP